MSIEKVLFTQQFGHLATVFPTAASKQWMTHASSTSLYPQQFNCFRHPIASTIGPSDHATVYSLHRLVTVQQQN
jgi:hypothetical protein